MSWFEIPEGDATKHYDFSSLQVDEAFLKVTANAKIRFFSLADECYKCPFTFVKSINYTSLERISTKYGLSWRVYRARENVSETFPDPESLICETRPKNLGEFGVYHLNVKNETCDIFTISEPVNIYKPLLIILAALLFLCLIWNLISLIISKCRTPQEWMGDDTSIPDRKKKVRIKAIDTFRGISLALMIFVNSEGGGYTFFQHATWNGLKLADLLFPWFMWIMGVCIPISIHSQLKKKVPRIKIFLSILRRSILLFLIGLSLNTCGAGPSLEHIRIMGVLQRFGVAYLVVASLVTFFMINISFGKDELFHVLKDILNLAFIWVAMVFIVALHVYFMFFYPFPGCPAGYVGPGGVQYNSKFEKCTGGFAGYIDKIILFGEDHTYKGLSITGIYKTGPFEPEGPFGSLAVVFHAFLGVQAGVIIISYSDWKARSKRWLIWGVMTGIAAMVLCQGRTEGGWIPINKNLWSLSFVLATSSLGFFLLTIIYVMVDVNGLWSGTPFYYPGMNAILVYTGHYIAGNMFPWHWSYGHMNTHFMLTIEALWGTMLWILISYWLHKQEFYLAL